MRCAWCDRVLTDKEVVWNSDLEAFEPCHVCLDVALEAAYSGGFKREEEYEEIPIVDGEIEDIWQDPCHKPAC